MNMCFICLALAVDCEVIISVVVNHRLWTALLLIHLCIFIIDDRSPDARNNRLKNCSFFNMLEVYHLDSNPLMS